MAVTIGPASRQEHTAALEFLFGSVENYYKSPELKHVKDRAQECQDLIDGVTEFYNDTYRATPWYRLYTKITIGVGRYLVFKVLCRNLGHMKVCYENQRGLPAKVMIHRLDGEFRAILEPYQDIINTVRERYVK